MSYQIQEARFELPHSPVLDASINILKFPELGTSLIISRSTIGQDETLQSNFEAQLKKLQQQVLELRFHTPARTRLGAQGEIEAIELQSQFSKGGEQVFQYQLAFLKPGTRQMMAFSYVKPQPLGADDAAYWTALKQSFVFTP